MNTGIVALVILLLGVNVYFRIKIMKIYKKLRNSNLYVDKAILFDEGKKRKLMTDNPQYANDIEDFSRLLRLSILLTVFLVILIAILAGINYLNT